LQALEIDSEPAKFRSLNSKEYPATKREGSTLQGSATTINLELKLQGASNYQARKINPTSFRNIQHL